MGASSALSSRPWPRQPFPHALGVGRGSRSGRAQSGVPIRPRPVAGCRAPRGREPWDQPERRGARGGAGTSSLSRASSGRRVSGRVCTATTRRGPPRRGQASTSILNARLIRLAHAQSRGFSAAGSAFTLADTLAATGASPGGAPYETTRARQAAFGASTRGRARG